MKKIDEFIEQIEGRDEVSKEILPVLDKLVLKYNQKKSLEKQLSNVNKEMDIIKSELGPWMEASERTYFDYRDTTISLKNYSEVQITEFFTFMKWCMNNLDKESNIELFNPKKITLRKRINDLYHNSNDILFSIPGIEREAKFFKVSIKDQHKKNKKSSKR